MLHRPIHSYDGFHGVSSRGMTRHVKSNGLSSNVAMLGVGVGDDYSGHPRHKSGMITQYSGGNYDPCEEHDHYEPPSAPDAGGGQGYWYTHIHSTSSDSAGGECGDQDESEDDTSGGEHYPGTPDKPPETRIGMRTRRGSGRFDARRHTRVGRGRGFGSAWDTITPWDTASEKAAAKRDKERRDKKEQERFEAALAQIQAGSGATPPKANPVVLLSLVAAGVGIIYFLRK